MENINLNLGNGKTALYKALADQNIALAMDIINHPSFNPNPFLGRSSTINIAISNGYNEIVKLLLKKGYSFHFDSKYEVCPFLYSIHNDEVFNLLKTSDYIFKENSNTQLTPIEDFIYTDIDLNKFEYICEKINADIGIKKLKYKTLPFTHLLIKEDMYDRLKILLQYDLNLDEVSEKSTLMTQYNLVGMTALQFSVLLGVSKYTSLLILHGADVNKKTKNYGYPFELALHSNEDVLHEIITAPQFNPVFFFNQENIGLVAPIHILPMFRSEKIVSASLDLIKKIALNNQLDITVKIKSNNALDGFNALMIACSCFNKPFIDAFLDGNYFNLNEESKTKRTALDELEKSSVDHLFLELSSVAETLEQLENSQFLDDEIEAATINSIQRNNDEKNIYIEKFRKKTYKSLFSFFLRWF